MSRRRSWIKEENNSSYLEEGPGDGSGFTFDAHGLPKLEGLLCRIVYKRIGVS